MLLHAARNGGPESADVGPAWTQASRVERRRVQDLAARLNADVALAGATGHLHEYADRPEYDLWRLLGGPEADVFELWIAFVKAALTPVDRARAILYAVRVKTDRIDLDLQRPGTTIDVLHTQADRLERGASGLVGMVRRATSRRVARMRAHADKASS